MFKKRFVSLLVLLCLILQMGVGYAAEKDKPRQGLEALIGFGILNGELEDFDETEKMTRREAALWVYRTLNLNEEYDSSIYSDVEAGSRYNNAITALTKRNILSGCGDGRFEPSRAITYKEFIKIIIDIMMYGEAAEMLGGFPTGYIKFANDLELNCGCGYDDELLLGEAAEIFYNALQRNIGELKSLYADKFVYGVADEETLLSKYLDIYMVEGRLTQNSYTSLTAPEGCGEGTVKIGAEVYLEGSSGASNLLGKNVKAFFKQTRYKDEIVFATAEEYKYSEITVLAKDIKETSSRNVLQYYPKRDSTRTKNLEISDVVDVIYNGKAYPSLKDIYPLVGDVRLLDYDRDNVYDVAFITDYKVTVADHMSDVTKTLFLKHKLASGEESIVFGTNDAIEIIDVYGEEIEYADIAPNSVVMVASSATGSQKYHKLIVVNEEVKGTLKSLDEEYCVIDDTEYELGVAFKDCINDIGRKPQLGKESVFLLDLYGDVVSFKSEISGKQYGYFKKLYCDEFLEEYYIKVLCTDGQWRKLELKEKLRFNGEVLVASDIQGRLSENQMIRFDINSNECVFKIETAVSVNSNDARFLQYVKNDTFRKSNANNNCYLINSNSFFNEYFLNSDTVIFIIPDDEKSADSSEYRVVNSGYLKSEKTYDKVAFYDADEFFCVPVIVIIEKTRALDLSSDNHFFMVKKVYKACIDDEIVSVVDGMEKGCDWSYTGSEADTFDGLKKGDLIRTTYNSLGRLYNYEVIHRLGREDVYSNIQDINPASVFVYGRVTDIDVEGLRIKVNDGSERVYRLRQDIPVMLYSNNEQEIKSVGISDIKKNDYVCLRISWSIVWEIAAYGD